MVPEQLPCVVKRPIKFNHYYYYCSSSTDSIPPAHKNHSINNRARAAYAFDAFHCLLLHREMPKMKKPKKYHSKTSSKWWMNADFKGKFLRVNRRQQEIWKKIQLKIASQKKKIISNLHTKWMRNDKSSRKKKNKMGGNQGTGFCIQIERRAFCSVARPVRREMCQWCANANFVVTSY